MHPLALLLKEHEGWLMRRVRDYAIERDYTRYTSTLEEAWRVSIVGLTDSICAALELSPEPWELGRTMILCMIPLRPLVCWKPGSTAHEALPWRCFWGL